MVGAIGIASNNSSNGPILDLWQRVGEMEEVPSMQSLEYPPHLTFAIYQSIDMIELRDALQDIFNDVHKIRIVFDQIRFFDASPLVLWASPKDNSELAKIHSAIHRKIDPMACDEHYRPEHWIAHCTLGTKIQQSQRSAGLSLASTDIAPFEVVFDTIDFIELPPVTVVESIPLTD